MGRDLYSIDGLMSPFLRVGERYVQIPAGQTLLVDGRNSVPRLIYFVGDPVLLEFADGRDLSIKPGDALAIGVRQTLRYRGVSPTRETSNHIVVIQFASLDTSDACAGVGTGRIPARLQSLLHDRFGESRHFPGALDRPGARDIMRLIRAEGEKSSSTSRWKVSGLCMTLVADLLELDRQLGAVSRGPVTRGEAAAEHARHYLLQHFSRTLTLSEVSWEVRMSGPHLARVFRRHFGLTVFDYLDRLRVDHAKQLLLCSELHLGVIAARCGYSSANLLCRHFKAVTGQTPLTYRLSARSHEAFSRSTLQLAQ